MSTVHMAVYSATSGLVALDKEQIKRTERPKYIIPSYDPTVVIFQCRRVALEERILKMVKSVTRYKAFCDTREDWTVFDITWVNGVPRYRKTTKHFEMGRDVIITTTLETTRNLKEKLVS
ncbi:hypothetical protein EVAR_11523_1 [Eumeta japonica]|uniref:Uncharacterized protein n=1 Tax=Eumeta variegata TaxID=151549 RepID=A0A4C1TYQ0_EUMVA|nr:hypothetical protein EVAR_11523_1 [Eumeta japonica]